MDEAVRRGLPLRLVHASPWERYEGVVAPGGEPPPGQGPRREHRRHRTGEGPAPLPGCPYAGPWPKSPLGGSWSNARPKRTFRVVGARRRGGLIGLELGCTAHRVLHQAACP
ncbi:hypothetical protein [Streptomyces sp. NBC_01216]|uniref:hypothetical protein n=1 Tax=Streptomyces sp. NBC_01216 TaxID=2903778 RepID=UPI003FA38241